MIKEIVLPSGTFRMYKPNVWTQVSGKTVVKRIEDAFNSGEVKK